jgi:hypothetical protein
MSRLLLLPLALLAAPAAAAPYYQAQPEVAPAQPRFVARDNVWRCADGACVSDRTASRPAVVCAGLVRQVGALRSFAVEGRAFDPAELTACNARAR